MRKEIAVYVAKLEKLNTKRELKSAGLNGKKETIALKSSKEKKDPIKVSNSANNLPPGALPDKDCWEKGKDL
jgi:hypothetical protein